MSNILVRSLFLIYILSKSEIFFSSKHIRWPLKNSLLKNIIFLLIKTLLKKSKYSLCKKKKHLTIAQI